MTKEVMAQSLESPSSPDDVSAAGAGAALAADNVASRAVNSDSSPDCDDSERVAGCRRTFPAALFLRLRVTQIVCGILVALLATVVCIEERGSFLLGGTGIVAGLAGVFAAGTNIHASRYWATEAIGWTVRVPWPPGHRASALGIAALWLAVAAVNTALIALVVFHVPTTNRNLVSLGVLQIMLALVVLVIGVITVPIGCRYEKYENFKYRG